jgi:hypothetical protein
MVTVESFRTDLPAFADQTVYPETAVTFWLTLAYQMLNPARWGPTPAGASPSPPTASIDIGAELFAAHNLSIEARNQREAASSIPPGMHTGVISAKSVDKVSVNYDVKAGINENDGHWNLTVYGTRFMFMVRMFGAGPIQIGPGAPCYDPLSSANAWPGIDTFPSPSGFS